MERAGRLIRKLKLSREINDPETRARAAWNLAAGKKIAEHTRATALVRDSLIVEVDDYLWQRQLATLNACCWQSGEGAGRAAGEETRFSADARAAHAAAGGIGAIRYRNRETRFSI